MADLNPVPLPPWVMFVCAAVLGAIFVMLLVGAR
jgi:hypothetical protein